MDLVLQSLGGLFVFLLLAWAMSEDRRRIPWRTVVGALAVFVVLAVAMLKITASQVFFNALNDALMALERATSVGTAFVFGYLGGAPLPYQESGEGSSFVLAFRALPLILVISALSALLFYWRILPWIVTLFARLLERSMKVGGAVGVSTAANIFLGMVEAPLMVRPYLAKLSRGEMFMVMTCGMASTAGTVAALYAATLSRIVPDALGHILVASFISAPAGIAVACLMVPHQGEPIAGILTQPSPAKSSMDAVTRGTIEGVTLLINIAAMLLVLAALVALANQVLGIMSWPDGSKVTLQSAFGIVLAPLAWLTGIPWQEAQAAGGLFGTKTVLNEFIAYVEMANLPAATLGDRSRLIMTYALCGFANFGSLGIMIGGMMTMVPERREDILSLGSRSLISGTLATCMCGALVGVLL
ncbi:MAG: NupC/NupG family nucleoside CNT transporter [Burkholderiales bacterium]